MSWFPNDLATDLDLLAYESTILSSFGKTDWAEKRRKALNDYLVPMLKSNGFDITKFRTRFEPDVVASYTASAYADTTGAATSTDTDDLNLATIFATAGTDALYIGSSHQFRGVSLRMLENVTAVSNIASVAYWNDAWTTLVITDKTQATAGKSFSKGGSISWRLPDDWVLRPLSTFDRYYWIKVSFGRRCSQRSSVTGRSRSSCARRPRQAQGRGSRRPSGTRSRRTRPFSEPSRVWVGSSRQTIHRRIRSAKRNRSRTRQK
jgi:hypothetical protein